MNHMRYNYKIDYNLISIIPGPKQLAKTTFS